MPAPQLNAWTWVIIGLLILVVVLVVIFPHAAAVVIGIDQVPQGTSVMYQVWSGFVPSITVITVFSTLGGVWRKMNCHVERCWRLGRYKVADGLHCVCRRHHPDDHVRERNVSVEKIAELHADAREQKNNP